MKTTRKLSVLAALLLAAGCDETATNARSTAEERTARPTGGPSLSYGPTASVSVHCPGNLEGGQSGQCVAHAYDASGNFTTSSGASWSTTTSSLIQVSSSGAVTGNASAGGTAYVSATIAGVSSSPAAITIRYTPVDVTAIVGQSSIRTNVDCFWWVSPIGGTGSYSYTWTVVSGPATGTATGAQWDGRSSGNFTLKVVASDGISADSATRAVTVSSTASLCVI